MLTSFWTTRATCTCGGRGGGDFFWAQPAHKSAPKRLNRRALPICNRVRESFMPFFSLSGNVLRCARINCSERRKAQTCLIGRDGNRIEIGQVTPGGRVVRGDSPMLSVANVVRGESSAVAAGLVAYITRCDVSLDQIYRRSRCMLSQRRPLIFISGIRSKSSEPRIERTR